MLQMLMLAGVNVFSCRSKLLIFSCSYACCCYVCLNLMPVLLQLYKLLLLLVNIKPFLAARAKITGSLLNPTLLQ